MATNPFTHYATTTTGPALDLVAITPNDSADLANVVRDIRVGGAGNVEVVTTAGATVLFSGCYPGEHLGPFSVARVKAGNTTATLLVGYV